MPEKVWILVTVVALAYGASAVVAVEVGEDDEDKVEKVVVEEVIEEHEEAGEMIPWIAGSLFLVSLAGLAMKNSDRVRLAFAVLSLVAIIPLADAGHTGGKLVYQYGAANAHLAGEIKALIQSGQFYMQNLEEEDEEKHDD